MIPFDFEYHRPKTLNEAYDCFMNIKNNSENTKKKPLYYSGGTEIISMAKVSSINFDAVIDLKGIAEYKELYKKDGKIVFGGGLTLSQIVKSGVFKALGQAVNRIADHTMQEKITLGGNLAGGIKYKESSLALMICTCSAEIMTKNGRVKLPFHQIFDGELKLNDGEFLISVDVPENYAKLPFHHEKITKITKIDYPLITILAIKDEDVIKAAITGYANKPIILPQDKLNDNNFKPKERIKNVVDHVSVKAVTELTGSNEYKNFVLNNMIAQTFREFKLK